MNMPTKLHKQHTNDKTAGDVYGFLVFVKR